MPRKLHVACSPLTNTIFCGYVLRDGRTWASNKTDVTIDALIAVAEHVKKFGKPVEVRDEDGNLLCRILVGDDVKVETAKPAKPIPSPKSNVSIAGLRRTHFDQLFSYLNHRDKDEWYYGDKKQFEKRHAELLEWVKKTIIHISNSGVSLKKKKKIDCSNQDPHIYPCDNCGKLRNKNEGGTVFTVCDECWGKRN